MKAISRRTSPHGNQYSRHLDFSLKHLFEVDTSNRQEANDLWAKLTYAF